MQAVFSEFFDGNIFDEMAFFLGEMKESVFWHLFLDMTEWSYYIQGNMLVNAFVQQHINLVFQTAKRIQFQQLK